MYLNEILQSTPIPQIYDPSCLSPYLLRNGQDVEFGSFLEKNIRDWLANSDNINVLKEPPLKKIKGYKIITNNYGANCVYDTKQNQLFSDLDIIFQLKKEDRRPKVFLGEVKLNKFARFTKRTDTFYTIGEIIFHKSFAGLCLFTPLDTKKRKNIANKIVDEHNGGLQVIDISEFTQQLRDSIYSLGYTCSDETQSESTLKVA